MRHEIVWKEIRIGLLIGKVNGLNMFDIRHDEEIKAYQLSCNFPSKVSDFNNRKTLEECKLTESQMRSKAYTKGQIKVTDTVTGGVLYFKNSLDKDLLNLFSKCTIAPAIKSGKPTRITSLSKYKNPCIIERIPQVKNFLNLNNK